MFTVTLNGTTLEYPTREMAEEFKADFENNLWNEVGEVEYKPEQEIPVMTLREALNHGNGALYGNSLVRYDEEAHVSSDRPWEYFPDIESGVLRPYSLTDAQLEQIVLFASSPKWIIVNNFIF